MNRTVRRWWRNGEPWIWLTAGTVSLSLLSVIGLLLFIASQGLTHFWPAPIYQVTLSNEQILIGEMYDRESIALAQIDAEAYRNQDPTRIERVLFKIGNRELNAQEFAWVPQQQIISMQAAPELARVERAQDGNFYGVLLALHSPQGQLPPTPDNIQRLQSDTQSLKQKLNQLEEHAVVRIHHQLEQLRLAGRRPQREFELQQTHQHQYEILQQQFQALEKQIFALQDALSAHQLLLKDMHGNNIRLNYNQVLRVSLPNQMHVAEKIQQWFMHLGRFISEPPREANTEGGVFPAIFGTVFMVLLMSVFVTPFGVIAAVYLHEYAKPGVMTRLIRAAVVNLAGVPSIVFGVFGLGFFVYGLGGSIDALFFPESLPSPTFGTPGVLWSALTLAILTLPVVIVSTEEGLSRIPLSVRHASLALGATKAETLFRTVLPMASPAIMTGLILAVARAAGEVAPLMLVGVVKVAPELPIDEFFPYIHLDRKFMHLGFHIYDVGFQSPNVQAARPLVYATAFLLVMVIVGLNLTAISIRNHLRNKFKTLEI